MKDIRIKTERKTSKVYPDTDIAGINYENLQGNIIFYFDEFVDGIGILELEMPNKTKGYIQMNKVDETYVLPIKSSLLSQVGIINMQLRITQAGNYELTQDTEYQDNKIYYRKDGELYIQLIAGTDYEVGDTIETEVYELVHIPIFKSNIFYLKVKEAINATTTIPEDYPSWIDILNEKIRQVDEALEEMDNVYIHEERVEGGLEVTVGKKDGTTEVEMVYDGETGEKGEKGDKGDKGEDAKINGYNTVTIQEGENIHIEQDGDVLTINATGGEEAITIQSTETVLVENYEVPALNDRQIRTAYDGVLAGRNVLIVNEMETLIANVIDVKCIENTDISIIILFEDKLILTYKMGGIIIPNNIEGKNAYETIKEVGYADDSYLFDVSYNNLDYAGAKEYFDNNATANGFSCSAIVKDGVLGRNYDWFYSNQAEFRVSTNKTPNRYATTGIATINGLEKDDVKLGLYSELYKYLPFSMVDGQNEKGLQAAILVVPNDNENTVGTVVATERTEIIERINALMLIRYALDHFASIPELKSATNEYLSIYVPQALRDMGYECHFIFKDDKSVEVLEFINNNCVWVDVTEKPVLTNFFISGVTFNQDGKVPRIGTSEVTACGLTQHSMGLERYNILVDGLNSNDTVDGILQDVQYTRLYKNDFSDNSWISEYCGTNGLTIADAVSDFYNTYLEGQQQYERRTRSNPVTDQTVHTSIYSDKLKVYTQERYGSTQAYEFDIAKSDEGFREVYTGYYDEIHDKFYPTMVFEEEMTPVNNAIFIDKTDINSPSTYLCIVTENSYHYSKTKGGILYWLNPDYYLYGQHTYLPAIDAIFLQEIYDNAKKGIRQTLCWTAPGNIQHKFEVLSITEFSSGLVQGYGLQIIVSGRYNCVYSWSGLDIGDIINPIVTEIGGSSSGNVDDVQINGTSIVENNIANIPYAGDNPGVIKVNEYYATGVTNGGNLEAIEENYQRYRTYLPNNAIIGKGTLENVVTGKQLLSATDVKNNVTSTDTDKPLSANMGKELNDRIQNLASIGKYLAMWDCTTGLPTTNPVTMPYTYTTGDYYVISNIGTTNYMPNGTTYSGTASTTQYTGTETLAIGDFFYYDGTIWSLMKNTGKTVAFANIAGDPMDNSNLANALNGKVGFTDYADINTGGIIKIDGITQFYTTSGKLYVYPLTYQRYTELSEYCMINKGTLENVLTGKGLVSDTDYATSTTGGVFLTSSAYATTLNANGVLRSPSRAYVDYLSASDFMFVSKGTLENVITGKGLIPTIVTSITNDTLVLNNHQEARLGTLATLILTMPSTIDDLYETNLTFTSGATATNLTYSATPIKWVGDDCDASQDFIPEPNKTYEISIKKIDSTNIIARVGAI